MDFINALDSKPDFDFRLSDNNVFMNLENKNIPQTSNVYNLTSFFEQPHKSLICHKGFFSELGAGKVFCKVCSVNMDSILELSEHLQTKSHEDSIITLIKSNLPSSLHKNMEFITFYDSNLYCNLCKSSISWSSENPFKTIVDIIAHNESSDHLGKKTNNIKVPAGLQNNDEALTTLQALAAGDSLLSENIDLIDYKVQPFFKCKLCKKTIDFEDNQSQMLINFSLHLNSEGHKKCFMSYLVLKSFEESHLSKCNSRHSFTVVKDKIFCKCSSRCIHPSVESLLSHVKEKLEGDLVNVGLSSELSNITLEEPNYCASSIVSNSTLTDFSESYNEQTESLLFEGPLLSNGENNAVDHSAVELNNKYDTAINLFDEVRGIMGMNNYSFNKISTDGYSVLNNDNPDVYSVSNKNNPDVYSVSNKNNPDIYSVLNKLENTDFFVSRVSKYLAKVNNQVMCDVCDSVICFSSNEKQLKDSIKHHFIGEKHKSFMEKLTFDAKETIVQLTFENPTVQSNKQYIKASGKYLHCILCQFTLTLCLDHEHLQKKLATHCLGKSHLEEIGKPHNSVFQTRPLSSQSGPIPTDDNTVIQLKPHIKHPGSEVKMKSKISNNERVIRPNPGSDDGKQHKSDPSSFNRFTLVNDPNAIKVSNLIPEFNEKGLQSLVKSFGPLRRFYLSRDQQTGLCKGFALVHYQARQGAERALDALNGLQTKYGQLTVKWAY